MPVTPAPPAAVRLDALTAQQRTHGFRVDALYLDDDDAPLGARFAHEATGFVLDYLRIESAPQGFIWVNTFPTSDKGEPHTQEHLLLGKGERGRRFGGVQTMSLASSSAFTMQWRTCYHLHTVAGHEVFWPVLENQLETLLLPDYSDEEIRREVRNFGVDQAADGTLHLAEKGTVYNEMVATYERPQSQLWRVLHQLVYGQGHPLALVAGGYPDDLRALTPADIRTFHREHYYLGNMGMVGAYPAAVQLAEVLTRTADMLERLATRPDSAAMSEAELPPARPAPDGALRIVDYPHTDAARASPIALAWPATRDLPLEERTLLELFLDAFAGDESTNLYKRLVDRTTRRLDVDATAVWSYVSNDRGQAAFIGLEGVAARSLNEQGLTAVRGEVLDELRQVAQLPAGDAQLVALNRRVQSRLTDLRRRLAKFLSSPPGFGIRGTGSSWMEHLHDLERTPGFRKSLTLRDELRRLEALVAGADNPWSERLARWGLFAAPHAVATRPSPEERRTLDAARAARLATELARLDSAYGSNDQAATLARFRAEYDTASAELDAASRGALPPFIDRPPLTLDDGLSHQVTRTGESAPLVVSRIDSMQSSSAGLAFRLDAVPAEHLVYLAILPSLLTESGLFVDGKAMPSEEVKETLRREILDLSSWYGTNFRTGRAELVLEGSGNDLAEAQRALGWMAKVIAHPDFRPENQARLRDLVDQRLTGLRSVMMRAEETWVEGPPAIYRRQRWPLLARTSSFLTRLHDAHRLRWMLSDPRDPALTAAVTSFLRELAGAARRLSRAQLEALSRALAGGAEPLPPELAPHLASAAALPEAARTLLAQAGKDLGASLADLPDAALAEDWSYLCKQMATDLERGLATVLRELDAVRRLIFHAGNARAWLVGSPASTAALHPALDRLMAGLAAGTPPRAEHAGDAFVLARLHARRPQAGTPRFVGLVNASTSSGVFVHSAAAPTYFDHGDDALLDHLAGNLYSGQGAHGLFMKTWAAGLAYGNGVRTSAEQGRIRYYADRCPELPQTMRFVVEELQKARPAPELVDYAVAQSFSSRLATAYEHRARSMADDLADGVGPDVVRAFRTRLLALRQRGGLSDALFERLPRVVGSVLPGYGPRAAAALEPVYFVIGPEAQLEAWERYLQGVEGPGARVERLYPRDFWAPADVR
jgi:Zn-dependent M16 (insulinase) family peptidase